MSEDLPPIIPTFNTLNFNPAFFVSSTDALTYEEASAKFLKFPVAQGTETFNKLSANEITATGDLLLNPIGSIDMNGKVLNMTNGEIHNCPLIHSKNNEDIVIEGKGTGKVILKSDSTKVMDIGDFCIVYRPLFMDFDVNLYTYKILIKSITDGIVRSAIIHTDERVRIDNSINSGGIDFVTKDATGASKNVLELSSASAIVRSPLNMTNNSIINCTLMQSPNNANIQIDAQGSGSDITFRNNLTDTLKIGPVGVQPYKPIYMSATNFIDRSIYSGALFLQNNVTGGEVGRLSQDNLLLLLENRANLGNIIFQTRDASSASTNVLEVSSGAVIIKRPITLNDASSANRGINSSVFNFNEVTGDYNPTVIYQIYQTGGSANHINYINSGRFNFSVIDAGSTLVTPLTITSTSNNIASNINLSMGAGSGIINQGITTGSLITNTLKKTGIIINSGSSIGSATIGLEVYDEGVGAGAGRGLLVLPNSGGGSYSNFNRENDCALISRSPQNSNAISITNWNSDMRNGIRVFTADTNNCGVTIQNGSGSAFSELRMLFNRTLNTFTNTFNNPIDFNPTNNGAISPARRLLSGLGTLSFTDILNNTTGGTDTGTILNNSSATVPGMQYTSNLNTGSHNFIVSDASFKYNPFSINFQNIRHNVPTALADFDIGSSLTLAGGVIVGSSGITNINVNSNTSNRGIGNYTIPSRGTYIVIFNFKISTVSADTPFTNVSCGITSVQNVYNTAGQYSVGNNSIDNAFTLQHVGVNQMVSTCVLNISNPSTTIYFTYNLVFGTVATVGIMNNYTITRIA
jgi:hypothetical protein